MTHKIDKHPSVIHQQDLAEICKPLRKLNISYFSHVNVKDKQFSALTNNPGFHSHYLKNKHYNADIHLASDDSIKDYFMWDLVERRGSDLEIDLEAADFGVKHIFTIIEKSANGNDYYHFATDMMDEAVNHTYLTKIDLLKLFIIHFNNSINTSKHLKNGYDIKFVLDDESAEFNYYLNSNNISADNRESFINDLSIYHNLTLSNRKILSAKQLQILFWLDKGKTLYDISRILGIAEVTINKHVADIKEKTGCYTQFQLGEIFNKLLSHYPDLNNHK